MLFRHFDPRNILHYNVKRRKWLFLVCIFVFLCIYDPRNIFYGPFWRQTEEALLDPNLLTIHCNIGRLGNQMGTYAALYGLARLNEKIPYGQPCNMEYLVPYFELSVAEIGSLPTRYQRPYEIAPYLREIDKYIPRDKNILTGYVYPSSYTFYYHVKNEIKREFQFKKHIVEYTQNVLHVIKGDRKSIVFVGVHVRKTDYCSWLTAFRGKEVDKTYILKAMDYFLKKYKNVIFVVVSDDRKWCFKELGDLPNVVIPEEPSDPIYDLAILSNCNHTIMTYGTFGFWGAYLAGGETVYYAGFLAPDSKFLTSELPYNKTYLPEWIGINTLEEDFWEKNNSTFHPKRCELSWWELLFGGNS